MSDENPYRSPSAKTEEETLGESEPLMVIARRTFVAWEKLRLIYICALAVVTLILVPFADFPLMEMVLPIGFGAVVANLCYFAGPALETYVEWLGYRTKWLRATVFAAGTMFACGLAILTLTMISVPN